MEGGDGVYLYSSTYPEGKTEKEISFHFAVVLKYQGFDWLFATNLKLVDVRGYVHLYKGRWGIETTFRVQDEVEVKSKSKDMRVRYFLFLFEALLYNLWQFFRNGMAMGYPFSAFIFANYLILLTEVLIDTLQEVVMDVENRSEMVHTVVDRLNIPRTLVNC